MKIYIALFVTLCIDETLQAHWTYYDEHHWPGDCNSGKRQSPINIIGAKALVDRHSVHIKGPLVYRGYQRVNVTASNDGHTLRWNAVAGVPVPTLSGGPLRGNYSFLQLHFHWLSEHAIDGIKYPLEVHIVHIKTGLTLEHALLRPDGLAVIGVMFEVFTEQGSDHPLEQLAPLIPQLHDQKLDPISPHIIDVSRMLSPNLQSYYTYQGSLTTPYCQEVVTWIVMDHPCTISDEHYKLFNQVNVGGINNYRSLQHSDRIVYRTASCSSILSPSLIGLIANLLACTSSTLTLALKKALCIAENMKKKITGGRVANCKLIKE